MVTLLLQKGLWGPFYVLEERLVQNDQGANIMYNF